MSNVPLPPGPVPLPDLVALQPGAVVRRTLVKAGGGTVTAFAFDALVIGVEGEAEVSISKASHRVKAGELLRLPANEPHGLKAVTPFKMILVMVKA